MQLNLGMDRVIPMIIWFVVLVGIHIGLGIWKKKVTELASVAPENEEAQQRAKIAYWSFKVWPFLAVIGLLIGFGS